MTWNKSIEMLIKKGSETIHEHLKSKNIGTKKTTTNIESKHPGYLHILYRYVIHTLGNKASFATLCICMNQRSCVDTELRDNF